MCLGTCHLPLLLPRCHCCCTDPPSTEHTSTQQWPLVFSIPVPTQSPASWRSRRWSNKRGKEVSEPTRNIVRTYVAVYKSTRLVKGETAPGTCPPCSSFTHAVPTLMTPTPNTWDQSVWMWSLGSFALIFSQALQVKHPSSESIESE